MINKSDVSMKFNDFAFESWQLASDKLRRMKDCEFLMINKTDFVVFSIRWLLQCADTMIKLYSEVELICTESIPDHECFKEALHCRKENLAYLLEHGRADLKEAEVVLELTYEKFIESRSDKLKVKSKKPSKSPVPVKRGQTTPTVQGRAVELVYIDSPEGASTKIVKKTGRKPAVKATGEAGGGSRQDTGTSSVARPEASSARPPAASSARPPAAASARPASKSTSESSVPSRAPKSTSGPSSAPKPSTKPQSTTPDIIDLTKDTSEPSSLRTRPARRRMI
jgi:hypothetical protein